MRQKVRWLDRRISAPGPFLALCTSEEEFRSAEQHLRRRSDAKWVNAGADATTHILENQAGELVCIVCINVGKDRSPIEVAGLLVHEAVHVWQQYLISIGERNPGDEQEAYGVQCIAQELLSDFAGRIKV